MDQPPAAFAPAASSERARDEITLTAALRIVWRTKGTTFAITVLFAIVAGLASLVVTPRYQVTVVVLPASNDIGSSRGGGASSILSQVGLGSIAGLSSSDSGRKVEAVALLQSESLTQRFIAANNLLPVLFASRWDPVRRSWKSNDPADIPTLWAASQRFGKIRSVDENRTSGLVTLRISWRDPTIATKWANDLIAMTNEYLRNKAIQESDRNVAYLNEQALKTNEVQVRQAIYSLLEEEFKKLMLARGNEEYALRVVDPAFAPDKPSYPDPVIWVLIGVVLGFFVAVMIAFARSRGELNN